MDTQPKKSFLKKSWWIFVLVIVAGTAVATILFKMDTETEKKDSKQLTKQTTNQVNEQTNTGNDTDQLPPCPANIEGIFTRSLVDLDKIPGIEPLGNTNGLDHILTVDHAYFMAYETDDKPSLEIYAPADLIISDLTSHELIDRSGVMPEKPIVYYFYADVCQGLRIWISGVYQLSPALKQVWDQTEKVYSKNDSSSTVYSINNAAQVRINLKAGDLIGYTKPNESIEITVTNQNLTPRTDVDWSYYVDRESRSHAVCFADLYTGQLKAALYDKFGWFRNGEFHQRTVEPRCGQLIQNIDGAIQGDWFFGKPANENESMETAGKALAFIHDHSDPSIGIISIAGTVTDNSMRIEYQPRHTGTIDRESSETTAGQLYCYNSTQGIKILAELIDDHHLKIESQAGTCGNSEAFQSPFTYER